MNDEHGWRNDILVTPIQSRCILPRYRTYRSGYCGPHVASECDCPKCQCMKRDNLEKTRNLETYIARGYAFEQK